MKANQELAASRAISAINTMLDRPEMDCHYTDAGVWVTIKHQDGEHNYSESTLITGEENTGVLWLKCRVLVNALCSKFEELKHRARFGIVI